MTPERHERLRHLFVRALALAPEARPAFLDQACAEDTDLRARADVLLARHTASPTPPPGEAPARRPGPAERPPRLVSGGRGGVHPWRVRAPLWRAAAGACRTPGVEPGAQRG